MLKLSHRLYLLLFVCKTTLCFSHAVDPLPSWNEGQPKQAIIQFIDDTTTPGSDDYIIPEERIAVFDQDGTLWVEQPLYPQFFFAIDSLKDLAAKNPEYKNKQPYQTLIEGDLKQIQNLSMQEVEKIITATHANMTVHEFKENVLSWLSKAVHPRFKKPYTDLIYQPMLEVIKYFKANGYQVYIVSGGGQEFIRAYADKIYGIPPERIIGSAGKVKYEYQDGSPALIKLPEVFFIDDKAGKPEAINLFIGRRPVAAFGNSDGDQQMLEWSQASKGKSFQLLVHHDDPIREYQYDVNTKVGKFSPELMKEAQQKRWAVVSMKNDWKVVFPTEKNNDSN
jgi:phosphoglycolate phosphatase-like HAD superfamily hydrolase